MRLTIFLSFSLFCCSVFRLFFCFLSLYVCIRLHLSMALKYNAIIMLHFTNKSIHISGSYFASSECVRGGVYFFWCGSGV